MKHPIGLIAILLLLVPGHLMAQSDTTLVSGPLPEAKADLLLADTTGAVVGTATDASTGTPLAGAHAFVGETMIGTATDADGRFELTNVPPGPHTLWISMIGFEPEKQDFMVGDTTSFTFDLALEPMVLELGEVTVNARKDRRWRKRYNTFERLFLGESDLSDFVTITNKEVLDFDANWLGRFSAKAAESLLIENEALGYRVQYVLKEFSREGITIRYDGDPFFEEMEPATAEQALMWDENRKAAFLGSFKHFLLALLKGNTYEAGFRLKQIPSVDDIRNQNRRFSIDPDDLLRAGEKPGDLLLAFRGVIEITYVNEYEGADYQKWQGSSPHRRQQHQRSWIRLTTGPTLIDPIGEIVDPYGVTVYGYYAFERVANDLPKEYRIDG
ncbi:MAG: carboxypeptidase-like regulatory domain-containing protein [Bacteroidota bacterium]